MTWSTFMTDPLTWRCGVIMMGCAAMLIVCVRAVIVLRPANGCRDRHVASIGDREGTAMLEFVLIFPILLFMALTLTQTAQLLAGNIYVHYAAFAATRAAVVQVPIDDPNDPANTIVADEGSAKFNTIRDAAVYALVPVSGRLASGDAPGDEFRDGLGQLYESYGRTPPPWVAGLAADRLRYAETNTDVFVTVTTTDDINVVRFEDIAEGDMHQFGPRDPITVRVEHRLHLSIPYVNALFADDDPLSDRPHALVSARCTLTNKGISDRMPQPPPLPRMP